MKQQLKNKRTIPRIPFDDVRHFIKYAEYPERCINSPGAETQKKFVQPADYLRSELTTWLNSYTGTMPGSMYNHIAVSVFYFDRLYGGTPKLIWN